MTYDESVFSELKPLNGKVDIEVGNNAVLHPVATGKVALRTTTKQDVILEDVLLVPGLSANLISFTRLMKKGCTMKNTEKDVFIFNPKEELLFTGSECKGMLKMNVKQGSYRDPPLHQANVHLVVIWHPYNTEEEGEGEAPLQVLGKRTAQQGGEHYSTRNARIMKSSMKMTLWKRETK